MNEILTNFSGLNCLAIKTPQKNQMRENLPGRVYFTTGKRESIPIELITKKETEGNEIM